MMRANVDQLEVEHERLTHTVQKLRRERDSISAGIGVKSDVRTGDTQVPFDYQP